MTNRIIRHGGTLIPLVVLVVFGYTLYAEVTRDLTWERVVAYVSGGVSLSMGAWALIQMARLPDGEFPSLFIVSLIYQKVLLSVSFAAISGFSLNTTVPSIPNIPESLLYPTLISSITATVIVNIVLYFGYKRGWLEMPVDPVPFRPLFRPAPPPVEPGEGDLMRKRTY